MPVTSLRGADAEVTLHVPDTRSGQCRRSGLATRSPVSRVWSLDLGNEGEGTYDFQLESLILAQNER